MDNKEKKILIVDDDETSRSLIRQTLCEFTNVYEAVLSSDGETPVVVKDLEIEDPRQKVEIQAVKYSSEARHTPLKGA